MPGKNLPAKEDVEIIYKKDGESFQKLIEKMFKAQIRTGSYPSNKGEKSDD